MSDFTSPWQGYDFSGLSAALSRIQEITRPALEALQNIQSTLQPIVEALEQYKPKVEEIGQVLLHVSRRFSAIEKMGDAQFVFWDYMTEEFVDEIVDSENISKTLREQMLRDRFSKVNRTIDKTLSSPAMQKHKRLYSQSAEAFRDAEKESKVFSNVKANVNIAYSSLSRNSSLSSFFLMKIDCVKMINLIYGLLLIVDLESTVSPNFSCINGV